MIQYARTWDSALIREIATHPLVWPHVTDDHSCAPGDFEPTVSDAIFHILASDPRGPLGLFTFVPLNSVCFDSHVCLYPFTWGAGARAAFAGAIEWIWDHTGCQRIVGSVTVTNRLAVKFARDTGFEQFGINRKSIMKNGSLEDQILLGLSRPACL